MKDGGKKRNMQIEIPDELAERIKDVLEFGVERGYYSKVPADAGIVKILERLVAEDEKKLGLVPKHNCAKHIKLDNKFDQVDDEMIFSGECSVCGKKVTQTFTYKDTREQKSDEVIDMCEKSFIEASAWRGMNANTIMASIIAGLDVLHDIGFGEDDHHKKQLRALIEKIVLF